MRQGDLITDAKCPDCGGTLKADKPFVLRTLSPLGVKDEEFWSTTCQGCRERYNYVPAEDGRLFWIRP
jgi:hypothetical protein